MLVVSATMELEIKWHMNNRGAVLLPEREFVVHMNISNTEKAMSNSSGFPWIDALILLYPLSALLYIAAATPAPPVVIAGYRLPNLGDLLCTVGFFAAMFRLFGLKDRWQALPLAAICIGIVLSSVSH